MSSFLRTTHLVTRLALGGLATGLIALAPTSAWAQAAPVFEGSGVLELAMPSGLLGDGASPADLYILALGPDGAPLVGLKGKPVASAGAVTDIVDVGGGLYKFTFTPAKTDGAQTATLTLKGKLPNKESFSRTWSVQVAPPRSHQLTMGTNPQQLVVGQDLTASIAINLAGGDRQNLTGVDLAVRPSAGTVDNLIGLGGGQFSALYTPQSVKYPHIALLTVVDRRDPAHTYGGMAVAMVGKADYPVTVAPNARVILKVGGREFGPIAADAQGRAMVPIVVPPGTTGASRVQIAPDGTVTEDAFDLRIPETRRIALFPAATSIPSDGRLQVPVRAFVVTPDGRPDTSAQVVFSTTAGAVTLAKHEGGGVYSALFTPPFGNVATQATLTVALADKPAMQADSMPLSLVPARPSSVTLTTEPAILATGADGFKVFAKVTGPDGTGLGSRVLNFAASGAKLRGEVKDLRNGDYQAVFSTTGSGPVELSATVPASATGNPLSRVLLLPARSRLPGDGLSSTLITVATLDEFGYPVPNQEVMLKLSLGDGTLPTTTKTNAEGLAQVYYTAGRKNGLVTVNATVGDLAAGTSLIQAPVGLALPTIPFSGSKLLAGLAGEWQGSLASARVEREGLVGAMVGSEPVSTSSSGAGAPTKLALLSDPASVSAGGSVLLRVNITDTNGRGVGGQQLDFLTSAGTVGAVTDLGGGAYQATLTVPAGTTGEVKVSGATRDGGLSAFMRVPVGGGAEAWGGNPFSGSTAADPFARAPAPVTAPVAAAPAAAAPVAAAPAAAAAPAGTAPTLSPPPTTTTTVTRAPSSSPSGRAWLRLNAGYSAAAYSYDQTRLTANSVLFEHPLHLDAVTQGFQANVRAWIPGIPYLGVDGGFALARYTLAPQPLCDSLGRACPNSPAVEDYVLSGRALIAGRYPFDIGDSQFWVGARAGYSYSGMVAYKVVENEIRLDALPVHSLAVGPEVGVEIGENVFLHTYFLEHIESLSSPFSSQFGLDGGYTLDIGSSFKPFVALGYDFTVRKVQVASSGGDIVGEVQDAVHAGTLSLGFQM